MYTYIHMYVYVYLYLNPKASVLSDIFEKKTLLVLQVMLEIR